MKNWLGGGEGVEGSRSDLNETEIEEEGTGKKKSIMSQPENSFFNWYWNILLFLCFFFFRLSQFLNAKWCL